MWLTYSLGFTSKNGLNALYGLNAHPIFLIIIVVVIVIIILIVVVVIIIIIIILSTWRCYT